MFNRFAKFTLKPVAVIAFVALSMSAFAGTFNFSGAFTSDDNLLQFQFNIAGNATVTAESFSYSGNGTDVIAGGFAPVLAIFGPLPSVDPTLLGFDDGGAAPAGCGPRLIDPNTHVCLDADLQEILTAGTYLVTLTENDNTPNGPDYAGGFNEAGNGNFTGKNQGFPGSSFLDSFGNQRTPAYNFSISGVDSASAVASPEPSAMFSLIAGLGLLTGAGLKRKKRS